MNSYLTISATKMYQGNWNGYKRPFLMHSQEKNIFNFLQFKQTFLRHYLKLLSN